MSLLKCSRNLEQSKGTKQNTLILKSWIILVFHSEWLIPVIEKLAFYLPNVHIIGSYHCVSNYHCVFVSWHDKCDCKFTCDYSEIDQVLIERINDQYFSRCYSISMEGVSLERLNNN